jgi:hypothetical protein
MREAPDFCWVVSDGALTSGTLGELLAASRSGQLPMHHPVWRQGWAEWIPLADALPELAAMSAAPPSADDTVEDLTLPRAPSFASLLQPDSQPTQRMKIAPADRVSVPPIPLVRPKPPPSPSEPPQGVSHSVVPPAPPRRDRLFVPAAIGSTLALAGAVVALSIVALGHGAPSELRRSTSALALPSPIPPARASAPFRCSLVGSASVVAERVQLGTPVEATTTDAGELAIGVTSTTRTGLGLVVGDGPRVARTEIVTDPIHLAAVVPSAQHDGATFGADRFSRTLPGSALSVGMTPYGFSTIGADGRATTIWPGQAAQVISRPTVVRSGSSFAVAFRRGDDDATVRFGWLGADGSRASGLGVLSVASGRVEAPALAAGSEEVLVGYAVRQPADSPWSIELGRALPEQLPSSTQRMPRSSSRDQRHVGLTALPGSRWLVSWAEGDRASGRSVRARVLDANLATVGPELTLHPSEGTVTTTSATATRDGAWVAFTERTGRAIERLWAARLSCH